MNEVTAELNRFRGLLRTLFEFDSSDLDFGIYRILKEKRGPIEEFLESRLPQIVDEAFDEAEQETLARRPDELRTDIRRTLGPDATDSQGNPRSEFRRVAVDTQYLKLPAEFQQSEISASATTKAAIYGYLFTFFSRYYDAGDFVSKRRYSRNEPYVVPYSGEETLLYWANRDQYYAKTSSRFGTYRFLTGQYAVVFSLRSERTSDEIEHFLVAASEDPVSFDSAMKTLFVAFENRPLTTSEKERNGKATKGTIQGDLLDSAERLICDGIPNKELVARLGEPAAQKERGILRSHLSRFARRNSADFFIHKDLRGFLCRELDFFIKNEVLETEALIHGNGGSSLQCARSVRKVGAALIDWVSQVEDLQKKLFEKKKFVLRTEYCLTIDKIPKEFWDEILSNKAQLEEWKTLFEGSPIWGGDVMSAVDMKFLETQAGLMVDSVHFPEDFKWRLLEHFDDLDDSTNGVLFKGDSFQALNVMLPSYRGKTKCIYIAPPYNHGDDGFLYKDGFRHSSWLTMMRDRALLAREMLREDGVIFVSIDDNEAFRAQLMLRDCFGPENFLCGLVAWQKRYSPPPDTDDIGYVHELILAFKATPAFRRNLLPLTEKQKARYVNLDDDPRGPWKPMDYTCRYTAEERPNLYYPIRRPSTGQDVWPKRTRAWAYSPEEHRKNERDNRIWWGKNGTAEVPAYKNFVSEIEQGMMPMTLLPHELVGHTDEAAKELRNLFPRAKSNVKPTRLIAHLATIGADSDSIIADYFAGSGSTAHAVIGLNRADKGRRKYVLVENDEHFEELLLPRIKKIVFGEDWQEGLSKGMNPVSHAVKYHTIEQYEDALNNVEFARRQDGQQMLSLLKDSYLLTYMLDFETQGSRAMLKLDGFEEPFEYKYVLERGGGMEERQVDLVETFNYLMGLKLKRMFQVRDGDRLYRAVAGLKDGERIAIVWRKSSDLYGNSEALERDSKFILDELIPKLWREEKPDRIFANSPCFVKGAEPIEAEFKQLMFSSIR